MDNSTLGTIYALKQSGKPYDEAAIDFWSEYTGTPAKYYGERNLMMIAENVFTDYIKTADNPSYELWNFFDCMRFDYKCLYKSEESFDKRVRNAIWSALASTRVRNNNGFVNGFRELEEES